MSVPQTQAARTHESIGTPAVNPLDDKSQRCDKKECGAAPFVRVRLHSGHDLVFCNHHFREVEPVLGDKVASIEDRSDNLLPVPVPV